MEKDNISMWSRFGCTIIARDGEGGFSKWQRR